MRKPSLKGNASIIFLTLIIAALILSAIPRTAVYAAENTTVSIIPKDNIFKSDITPVASIFVVEATVTDVTDLWNWQIKITFDPSMLACVDASVPSDSSFNFPLKPEPIIDNTTGYVMLGASQLGTEPGVSGSGVLASITFKIISVPMPEKPSCDIAFDEVDTYMLDPNMVKISFTPINGSYEYTVTPMATKDELNSLSESLQSEISDLRGLSESLQSEISDLRGSIDSLTTLLYASIIIAIIAIIIAIVAVARKRS